MGELQVVCLRTIDSVFTDLVGVERKASGSACTLHRLLPVSGFLSADCLVTEAVFGIGDAVSRLEAVVLKGGDPGRVGPG